MGRLFAVRFAIVMAVLTAVALSRLVARAGDSRASGGRGLVPAAGSKIGMLRCRP
jgi:hypothetical protein